jgi:hypothetical protein
MTKKENFKKWAAARGVNVTESEIEGYTFAYAGTEDMYLAYLKGIEDAAAEQPKRVQKKDSGLAEKQ